MAPPLRCIQIVRKKVTIGSTCDGDGNYWDVIYEEEIVQPYWWFSPGLCSFTGDFPINGYPASYYSISLRSDGGIKTMLITYIVKRECPIVNPFLQKPLYPDLSPLLLPVSCRRQDLVNDTLPVLVGEECVMTITPQEATSTHTHTHDNTLRAEEKA